MRILAVDYDGTITLRNDYPNVGEFKPGAIEVLKELQKKGFKLILWTCRTGSELDVVVDAMKAQGLTFNAVNDHLDEVKSMYACDSRKVFADMYIDDMAYGSPAGDPLFWINFGRRFGIEAK